MNDDLRMVFWWDRYWTDEKRQLLSFCVVTPEQYKVIYVENDPRCSSTGPFRNLNMHTMRRFCQTLERNIPT